jgi:hypothetical protein
MPEPTTDEILERRPVGGDTVFVKQDIADWKNWIHFQTEYEDVSDYWRPKKAFRSFYEDSIVKAKSFFESKGAIFPVFGRTFQDDAIEVQLYPRTYKVVFLIRRAVAGEMHECAVPHPLSADMVGWLKTTGRWPKNSADALN